SVSLCLAFSPLVSLFECSAVHPDLHSFPTRRSSDLARDDRDAPGRSLAQPEIRHPRHDEEPPRGRGLGPVCVLGDPPWGSGRPRSEEHTSELQSRENLVCRLLLEKKKTQKRPLAAMQ